MTAGTLSERVAFDRETQTPDGYRGQDRVWTELFQCWAEFRYERGREAPEAGGLTGSAVFKVRVRASDASRALTVADTMRDRRTGVRYNIREVDAITDRSHVWLIVESGVAT